MSKSSKLLRENAQKVSTGISSSNIIDLNEFRSTGIIGRMKNIFKNRVALSQTESCFIDFKRKTFPEMARNQYHLIYEAHRRKDKVDLMKLLSVPLFDLFKSCLKEKKDLPFYLYKDVLDVQIMQARIYSLHKHNLNPNQTWHQLTLKFICKDLETKKEVPQFNVFERREVDSASADWRLCHIE